MKKVLLLSALLMAFATQEAMAQNEFKEIGGTGTSGNPYTIATVEAWNEFCNSFGSENGNKTYEGEYVKLTANIGTTDAPVTRMAAETYEGNYFKGTFDGGNFTLTVDYQDGNFEKATCAPFRYLDGATIKNLKTAGIIHTRGFQWRGGIAGVTYGTCTLENCMSQVTITSGNYVGNDNSGGLVGYALGNITFTNCIFSGSFEGLSNAKWQAGGFVGQKGGNVTIAFNQCLFAPTRITPDVSNSATFVYTSDTEHVTYTQVYCTQYMGAQKGTLASLTQPEDGTGIWKQTKVNGTDIYAFASISGIAKYYPYTGNEIKPIPELTCEGNPLMSDFDYTYSYIGTGFTESGKYQIKISDTNGTDGTKPYHGTITVEYEVTDVDLVQLQDAVDNTTAISGHLNQSVNVKLDGRTFYKDGEWNTICLPFDVDIAGSPLDFAGVDVREFIGSSLDNEGTLTLNFSSQSFSKIEAFTPYLIKWNAPTVLVVGSSNTDVISAPSFYDVVIKGETPAAVTFGNVTFQGNFSPVKLTANNKSVLYLGDDNNLYYPGEGGMTVNSFRAYFVLDGITVGEPAGAALRSIVLNLGDDQTTGILSVPADAQDATNDALQGWYDLSGRRLESKPTQRGIYIYNGKKVVVK